MTIKSVTSCKLPEYGAMYANTRTKCPTCDQSIVWDSPYGPGRWVHTEPQPKR